MGLVGDLGGASKSLATAIKVMEAVDRMVNGATLPEPLASDWKARSTAILGNPGTDGTFSDILLPI